MALGHLFVAGWLLAKGFAVQPAREVQPTLSSSG